MQVISIMPNSEVEDLNIISNIGIFFDLPYDVEIMGHYCVVIEDGDTANAFYNPLASALLNQLVYCRAFITRLDAEGNYTDLTENDIEKFKKILDSLYTVEEKEWLKDS